MAPRGNHIDSGAGLRRGPMDLFRSNRRVMCQTVGDSWVREYVRWERWRCRRYLEIIVINDYYYYYYRRCSSCRAFGLVRTGFRFRCPPDGKTVILIETNKKTTACRRKRETTAFADSSRPVVVVTRVLLNGPTDWWLYPAVNRFHPVDIATPWPILLFNLETLRFYILLNNVS